MTPIRWAGLALLALALLALLAARRMYRELTKPLGDWGSYSVQYSALHKDGSRTIYPSEAAYRNDVLWVQRVGAVTYGRAVVLRDDKWVPIGPWIRTYVNDLKTHRRED